MASGSNVGSFFMRISILAAGAFLFTYCGPASNGASEDAAIEEEARDRDSAGVREVGAGQYEVVIVAYDWGFAPAEIRLPAGAEVTFRGRSRDNPHGLRIEGTDIQITLLYGRFVEATHTFNEPGEYAFLCHEYCGGGHDAMRGVVIVE